MNVIEKEKTIEKNWLTEKQWWKEEVVYQIYPKSFKDANNDGSGDLAGIIEKLDYLQDLGITMLWICPIFTSPMADNGYDISDYQGIQPEFGTMADLDRLLAETKKRGMKLILDLVVNHTSDEHAWFQKALADPDSKYRDYYIFRKGKDGKTPNNWRSIFGGSVWETVPEEDEMYYFHTFDKKQPDLNWENPQMRQKIYEMINWWLDKGVAGFRIDSITFIKKDQDYGDAKPDGADGLASVKLKTRNRPGIADFLQELNQATFLKHKCVTVGEAPGVTYQEYQDYIGPDGYFNMIFDFHYADIDVENGSEWFRQTNWTVPELKELLFTSQAALQDNGWGANFLENHDQPRALTKYIKSSAYQNEIGAKALATLFFFLRGTPFIYQGQELGMKNFNRTTIDDFNDLSSIDNYQRAILEGYSKEASLGFVNKRSRDNSRTPFPWTNEKNLGFSQDAEPWLKAIGDEEEINAADQVNAVDSTYAYYKKMIALRNHSEERAVLIYGTLQPLELGENIIAYQRGDQEKITVVINFSDQVTEINNFAGGTVLLTNYPEVAEDLTKTTLQPYQAVVFKEEKSHG